MLTITIKIEVQTLADVEDSLSNITESMNKGHTEGYSVFGTGSYKFEIEEEEE